MFYLCFLFKLQPKGSETFLSSSSLLPRELILQSNLLVLDQLKTPHAIEELDPLVLKNQDYEVVDIKKFNGSFGNIGMEKLAQINKKVFVSPSLY
ncbi:hypothetical protein P8452_16945 [Trifolium repens]|nr:hypothetical protein P8452_16945 [Trifolium repens]